MKASERLALNTTTTYGRSVVVVGLALFSSRWVLNAMGETDFGLFSVVGSLVLCLTFLNTVMANSSARHFAYAIGQGDAVGVNTWFNLSFRIHVFLAFMLVGTGWPIGEYCIRCILAIPPERMAMSVSVFRMSLVSAFVSMISVPFVAMFNAKQQMSELALWGVLQALFVFGLAWVLTGVPYDRLAFFAGGMVLIHVAIHTAQIVRASYLFPECSLRPTNCSDRQRLGELVAFALWSLAGRSGGVIRDQGSAIVVNLQFGPSANAAFGIARQVAHQATALSASVMSAVSPEIATREGRGQRDYMVNLAARACKLGTLMILLFAIPFAMEAPLLLNIWLVSPPAHAAVLGQFLVVAFCLDRLGAGYMYAVQAHGKIAVYQTTMGCILLSTLPLAWLLLRFGMPLTAVGFAFVTIEGVCLVTRLLWAKRLFGISIGGWLAHIAAPCIYVAAITCVAAAFPRLLLPPSWTRLVLVSIVAMGTTTLSCWHLAFTQEERQFILNNIVTVTRRGVPAAFWYRWKLKGRAGEPQKSQVPTIGGR